MERLVRIVVTLVCAAFLPLARPAMAQTLPVHRIGVRTVNGVGEFYDRTTNNRFIPRGNNFIRLAKQTGYSGSATTYHSTFNVGVYDGADAEQALSRMRSDGYNIVRTFLNSCCTGGIGDPSGGLKQAYLLNVADFLKRAKSHGVVVMFTIDVLPEVGGYLDLLAPYCCSQFDSDNLYYLTQGGINADIKFWVDFIRGLESAAAPTDTIFAYELRSEQCYLANAAPFTLTSGKITAANGQSYDMSNQSDRQKLMDDGIVYFVDQVRAGIKAADPTALVDIGIFDPLSPVRQFSPERVSRVYPVTAFSQADFVDVHPYPLSGRPLDEYVAAYELGNLRLKPILMGEYGLTVQFAPETIAAQILQNWQTQSCQFGFSGWLLWTWDPYDDPSGNPFWSAIGGKGILDLALAPIIRADPCSPASFPGQNLSYQKPATASAATSSSPASNAVDGNLQTPWSSGGFAPQWIEINLLAPQTIGEIRLTVNQLPDGETVHRIWARGPTEQYRLLEELQGFTKTEQVIDVALASPWTGIQYVKVETVSSPSWVAWEEIEILSPGPPKVALVSPVGKAAFRSGETIPLFATGAAYGASIKEVQFFQNGAALGVGQAIPIPPGSRTASLVGSGIYYIFNWPNAPAGTYYLTAQITDSAGVTTFSTPIVIVVSP